MVNPARRKLRREESEFMTYLSEMITPGASLMLPGRAIRAWQEITVAARRGVGQVGNLRADWQSARVTVDNRHAACQAAPQLEWLFPDEPLGFRWGGRSVFVVCQLRGAPGRPR